MLRRGDGVVAYNLAVVVDDVQQGIDQVVRGDDLLPSAPRQAYLATLLGAGPPTYVHVPMAVNADGKRLAKRDGAVTYRAAARARRRRVGADRRVARPRGIDTLTELLETYDPANLPREPWVFATT